MQTCLIFNKYSLKNSLSINPQMPTINNKYYTINLKCKSISRHFNGNAPGPPTEGFGTEAPRAPLHSTRLGFEPLSMEFYFKKNNK